MRHISRVFALLSTPFLINPAFGAGLVGIQDQANYGYTLKVNSDGSINTSQSGASTVGVEGRDGSTQASDSNPLPTSNTPASYQLLNNASASGSTFTAVGGNYLLSLSGTFGGTTVSLTSTINGVTTTLGSYTSAITSPPCFAIAGGTTIQATVTGGSPSGLNASLGGVGSGGCAGTASTPNLLYTSTGSVPINVSTATTTQLVALSAGKAIYITSYDFQVAGSNNVTLEYGTGASCGTGTTVLTGPYNLLTGSGIAKGAGIAPILLIPAGNALCILTSAAVQLSGSVSYSQF